VEQLIQFLFGSALGVFFLMMLIGYFCWPALLVYAVFSQSRSLVRIARATEALASRVPDALSSGPLPASSPADRERARMSLSAFGR
jgi:hypothetical protein